MLNVFSRFLSLQGESSFQGLPCYFIRLAGCNLNCVYCDATDACKSPGRPIYIEDLVEGAVSSNAPLVEVTGGEPLLQLKTPALLTRLCDQGRTVLLETNGSVFIGDLDRRVHVVLDVKCPGSGESHSNCRANFDLLPEFGHDIKFVVSSHDDVDWAISYISRNNLFHHSILFSPVTEFLALDALAKRVLEGPFPFRVQAQLHKLIWPNGESGDVSE